jgi:hypothetical protein
MIRLIYLFCKRFHFQASWSLYFYEIKLKTKEKENEYADVAILN